MRMIARGTVTWTMDFFVVFKVFHVLYERFLRQPEWQVIGLQVQIGIATQNVMGSRSICYFESTDFQKF